MAKKAPVSAAASTRKITPGERKALERKAAIGKADPVNDTVYPPKKTKASPELVEAIGERVKTIEKATKTPPQPPVSLDEVPDIADALPALALEYLDILNVEAVAKARKSEISEDIRALLEAVEQRSVLTPTWQVSRARGMSVTISKTLLLSEGVTAAQVEAATVRKPTAYVVVTDPREAKKSIEYREGEE